MQINEWRVLTECKLTECKNKNKMNRKFMMSELRGMIFSVMIYMYWQLIKKIVKQIIFKKLISKPKRLKKTYTSLTEISYNIQDL